MAKGADFEEKSRGYLKSLFEQLGFRVTEARRQRAGTQNGFDIRIGFLDDRGKERKLYFECKDYKTEISWNDIAVKILELHASSHLPDGYIALSPHVDFSNININMLDKLADTVRSPIQYWTPETNVKEYFSVDEPFFKSVYGETSSINGTDKSTVLQKVKAVITNMLRQKDELAAKRTDPSLPKELTLKIPRIHADDIIGRTVELEELHRLLFNNERVVVVNGLGGIGKTTLVQGYISAYYKDYRHVAWISQLTDDVANDIINAEGLAENLSIDKQGKEVMQLCREILLQLKARPDGPNLLILDNANEKLATLKDLLPGQPQWHVLVTSRERVEGFYPKTLDFLSPDKAIALFKKHCPRINQEDQIAELVKAIDYHTLTIEILAKTAQLRRLDMETLKRSIQDDLVSNVYVAHKGEKIDKVRSYLSSIFTLSGLNEEETWLMKQFTCLPTEFHAYKLLLELIDPDDKKKEVFAETLDRLVEQGWLLYNEETDAYKMHVIVKEVALKQLLPQLEDIGSLLDKVAWILKIDETKDNPVDKFRWIPYGHALLNNFPSDVANPITTLQNNLALVLIDLGDYTGARALLEKAAHSAEHHFGADHSATAIIYSNLGMALKELGDYARARTLLEKALSATEHDQGSDHPSIADRYVNLAIVLKETGDYGGARDLLEKAVCLNEQNFGPDNPATAKAYSNLALVLNVQGDYGGARNLMEKALRTAEQRFGSNHPTTAVRYSNLAAVLQTLGDFTGARILWEKALHSNKENFGPDHPITAVNYSNLATVLKELGDYAGARALLEKALRVDEQLFGPDHPSTAAKYSNLATVLQDLGDYTGARDLMEKAVRSNEQTFGPNHPNTAISYSKLAMVHKMLGDYIDAQALLEKAVVANEQHFGLNHPSTAGCYSNLATVLQAQGDYVGARALLEKVVCSDEQNFGSDHPTTAQSYSNLATVLQAQCDYVGARALLEKSVYLAEQHFGSDNPATAIRYSNLSSVLNDLGDHTSALELSEKSLSIFKKTLPEGHPYIKTVQSIYDSIKDRLEAL